MPHYGQPPQQRQIYVAQFYCRQCRFTSVDLEGIRCHANSHLLEAAANIRSRRPTEQTRQLRERNLLFNPYRQILPSPVQPTRGIPRGDCIQRQRSPQGSGTWRPPTQTQPIQAAQHIASQQTQETSNVSIIPLIDQLDHPIPVIIDLDGNQNGGTSLFDLTLRL